MNDGIKDRGFILVGGSRGIGRSLANILCANGARVAIISRGDASETATELSTKHGSLAYSFVGDAGNANQISGAIEAACAALGHVHGLVTTNAERQYGGLLDSSDEDWQAAFDSLVMGTVRCCRAVIPHFLKNGVGSIVTLGAFSVRSPKPYLFPYTACKASIVNITKNISLTYGAQGIRANCVAPGPVRTKLAMAVHTPEIIDAYHDAIPLNRYGNEREIGEVIFFLCSEKASFVTGQVVAADGGFEATGVGLPALRV